MTNKYSISAIIAIAIVALSYIYKFYYVLNYSISNDTAVWAQLGDYAGGLLNPVLSFISIILLIKSLTLQNEANLALRKELKNNKKTDKLRAFENQFFNMLDSQNKYFKSFKIQILQDEDCIDLFGAEAVIEIEEVIEEIREQNKKTEDIVNFLDGVDSNDQLFGVTRTFYILVKIISDQLSDDNGFSRQERESHMLTLINFTDFPVLRLIMISMQFLDYKSVEYLKESVEFNSTLSEVGIGWDLY